MEKKKTKLTISGSSKKTMSNIEIAKTHGKNSVLIQKKTNRYVNKTNFGNKNQKSNFELMNVGLGESISIENLVKKIVDLSGKKLYINYDKDKPSIDTKIALDVNKANRLINWTPTTSLDVGIEKTIKWYRENR